MKWVNDIVEKMMNLEKMICAFLRVRRKNMKRLKPLETSKGLIVRVVLKTHMPQ